MRLELRADDGNIVDVWDKTAIDEIKAQPSYTDHHVALTLGYDILHVIRKGHSRSICDCKGLNVVIRPNERGEGELGFEITTGPHVWRPGV